MNALLFFLAAACEIAGCYAFWAWLRLGKDVFWLAAGGVCLAAFAVILTQVESEYAGRAYAAYGGVYIASSLLWLAFIERSRPYWSDFFGVALCLLGAAIIFWGPRFFNS